jgi:A/G-specific adenine glycosylase
LPLLRRARPKTARASSIPAFRAALLAWYKTAGRHHLPWRKTFSPYPVLVSEFMLQQTTVATVIPYYHRFLKAFPTVQKLAAAPEERVMELWSGLGYYARARNLQACAQKVVKDFGGRLPDTLPKLLSLPGVGRYTAGAVLSFAFNKPAPVVDGNIVRVLSRVFGVTGPVKDPKVLEDLWALAARLVPPKDSRAFHSALMDLGATVCRPGSPACLICPLAEICWARRNNRQDEIPLVERDRPRKDVHVHAALVQDRGRWAFVQRTAGGLYGGLWEFPGVVFPRASVAEDRVRGSLERILGEPLTLLDRLPTVKHVLSHREMYVHPWVGRPASAGSGRARSRGPGADRSAVVWRTLAEARAMAVSSLTRRLMAAAEVYKGDAVTTTR